jgi:hypothetical protein
MFASYRAIAIKLYGENGLALVILSGKLQIADTTCS